MATTLYKSWQKALPREQNLELFLNQKLDEIDAAVGNVPGARVTHSANQSVLNGTATALNFNSERYDTDNIHSTSSNTSRLTCVTPGRYSISTNIRFDINATGYRKVGILLNGATYIAFQTQPAVSGVETDISLTTQYQLVAGNYVEVWVQQNSGGALNVISGGNFSPEFMMSRIG